MQELAAGVVLITVVGQSFCLRFICLNSPKDSDSFWLTFATKIGKPDPEVYVDEGKWKARQGGNGVDYAKKSAVSFEPCVLEENAFNYELQRPISDQLYELFKPFGIFKFRYGQ